MRRLVTAVALMSACATPMAPSSTLAGTWAEAFSFPGASLILTIDSAGNGNGSYAIEAGRSGTVQVTGTIVQTTIMLTIRYDYGVVRTFTGTLSDANHLSGVFDDTSGTIVFTRR